MHTNHSPLPREFYDRNALEVAPALLGCLLARRDGRRVRLARIVETEAYVGEHDLACHAKAGRTPRTDPMFGEPGHAYVYFVYGMHTMLNTVCGPGSAANAVLIRAAAPLNAEEEAKLGLRVDEISPLLHSASGPGNLCTALGVTLAQNRADLCDPDSELFILPRTIGTPTIWAGPRIGVDYAGVWASEPFRFCDRDDPHVSRPRPALVEARKKMASRGKQKVQSRKSKVENKVRARTTRRRGR